MEPARENPDTAAEEALLHMVDQIMDEEWAKARQEDPAVLALMKMFRLTPRQAVASIERAQRNVAMLMIAAGDATEDQIITSHDVGSWATEHLSHDQRLCITSHAVGSQVQLDWFFRRDPETGEVPEPDYSI